MLYYKNNPPEEPPKTLRQKLFQKNGLVFFDILLISIASFFLSHYVSYMQSTKLDVDTRYIQAIISHVDSVAYDNFIFPTENATSYDSDYGVLRIYANGTFEASVSSNNIEGLSLENAISNMEYINSRISEFELTSVKAKEFDGVELRYQLIDNNPIIYAYGGETRSECDSHWYLNTKTWGGEIDIIK